MKRSSLAAAPVLGLALLVGAAPAQAAAPRTGTLTCGAEVIHVSGQLYGNAYDVVGSTRTFVVTSLRVGDDVLVKASPGDARRTTHTCDYTVSDRSQTASVQGFLTPAR